MGDPKKSGGAGLDQNQSSFWDRRMGAPTKTMFGAYEPMGWFGTVSSATEAEGIVVVLTASGAPGLENVAGIRGWAIALEAEDMVVVLTE